MAYAEDPTFRSTINLSNTAANSNNPQTAVSGNYVYVVWRENNDIFFRASSDNGVSFDSSINLSSNVGVSQSPRIAASGSDVYVIWQDDTGGNNEILFKASNDNGAIFDSTINLSSDGGDSGGLLSQLEIAAAGSNAYVVWRNDTSGNPDILFTASNDNGASFGSITNLSSNSGSSNSPDIAAAGSNAYVAWRDNSTGNFDILFKASGDSGASFGGEINLSSNSGSSQTPQVAAAGSNAYVAWRDDTPGNFDILFKASGDSGTSFGGEINLSSNSGSSQSPQLDALGSDVFVTWSDNSPGNIDALFKASSDSGASFGGEINLSDNLGSSQSPDVAASADDVYATWYDSTSGNNEVLFRASDDAPVADPQSVSTDEDTALPVTLTGSDVEGDALTFSIVTNPTNGTLSAITPIDSTSASVTYTPNSNFNGADSFVFKVNDGTLDSNNATVSITVNAINDAPVANNDSYSVDEDNILAIAASGVLGNDTDTESSPLTAVLVDNVTNGTLALSADGSFTYTPFIDFNGVDSFTYVANDGPLNSTAATVTITVNSINDAPVANNDAVIIDEDTSGTDVLANDTDVDNDPLTITSVTIPTNGTAVINPNNTITYTPDSNFFGADSFDYEISDGNGGNDTATVNVTVNPVNDAPIADSQSVLTDEDTALPITLTGSDVDGDALTFSIVTNATSGTLGPITPINSTTASVTYTPNSNFNGPDSFTFKANDSALDSNNATISITVNAINDAPVADEDSVSVDENEATAISVLSNDSDVDGDSLTVTSVTDPPNGSAIINGNGTITYTPTGDYNGPDSFDYTISDDNGGFDTATVNVIVEPMNDAPVANDDAVSTDEDTILEIPEATLLANDTDADGDTLTVSSFDAVSTAGGTIVLGSSLDYTPPSNFNGVDTFTYTASDGNGGFDTATVTVTVNAVNDEPVLGAIGDQTIDEQTLLTFTATATDVDIGQTLTFSLIGAPAGVSITSGGVFTWTPTEAQGSGVYTFDVVVTDDGSPNLSDSETIDVTVNEVNTAPVLNPVGDQTIDEETLLSFTATASDSDVPANTLTFSLSGEPAGASITSGGVFTWTPTEAQGPGVYTFDVVVSDGTTTDSETIDVTVNEVNTAPVLSPDPILDDSVGEGIPYTFTATASDSDLPANTLTFTVTGEPAWITV
ncbi:MAG: tandem-95 repeat protein, partial [Nitrososphaerales archaeon]